jgi:ribulose-5-phosphate 4-epimerase/fuculose-1-phosphate aldolase
VALAQVKPSFAPEELRIRRALAALYRLFHHYGWTDLTATHLSARLPSDPSHYLMNSFDFLFEEISVSTLSKVSFDGRMVTPGRRLNLAGHIIHSGVLKARPEINFVLHSHTRAGIAVSSYPGGLLPLTQHAGVVLGTLSTHPYQDSTAVADEGELLARDLGQNYAMLLENHGLLTVGRTAAEAFTYHYYLEMACKVQVDILSMTGKPIVPAPEAIAPVMEWGNPATGPKGDNYWPALLRLVERKYPDYLD